MVAGDQITKDVVSIIEELGEAGHLRAGKLLVIGASTSEVLGQRIGSSGAETVAAAIYDAVERTRAKYDYIPVFQCCEHLNRALVIERVAAELHGLDEVAAIPVAKAGGSMAALAYKSLSDAVLVETVRAHAGIDIGDTLIGMHLRRVAVPFRPKVKQVGFAHVTAAFTRPKLIGGERAVYRLEPEDQGQGTC